MSGTFFLPSVGTLAGLNGSVSRFLSQERRGELIETGSSGLSCLAALTHDLIRLVSQFSGLPEIFRRWGPQRPPQSGAAGGEETANSVVFSGVLMFNRHNGMEIHNRLAVLKAGRILA
jgi:hypothetical protein